MLSLAEGAAAGWLAPLAEPLAEPLEVADGIMRSARNGSFQGAESKHRVSDVQWPWKWKGKGKQEEKCKNNWSIVVIQLFFAIAVDFQMQYSIGTEKELTLRGKQGICKHPPAERREDVAGQQEEGRQRAGRRDVRWKMQDIIARLDV
jgi:hypothetical protein